VSWSVGSGRGEIRRGGGVGSLLAEERGAGGRWRGGAAVAWTLVSLCGVGLEANRSLTLGTVHVVA
jgi:hypothetical protein